jgi:hypothetical protein
MTVLKDVTELECLNSRGNFNGNKRFLNAQLEKEQNPAVRVLLEADLSHLDRIQVQDGDGEGVSRCAAAACGFE